MPTVTVSAKGWIVIPAEYRRKHGLDPGVRVQVVDYGGVLAVVPSLAVPVRDARGMLRGGPPLTAALLADRAREQEHESARWVCPGFLRHSGIHGG
jgi:AbrB family looped-hinge helix DNA binding protein